MHVLLAERLMPPWRIRALTRMQQGLFQVGKFRPAGGGPKPKGLRCQHNNTTSPIPRRREQLFHSGAVGPADRCDTSPDKGQGTRATTGLLRLAADSGALLSAISVGVHPSACIVSSAPENGSAGPVRTTSHCPRAPQGTPGCCSHCHHESTPDECRDDGSRPLS
jgi:hypothetical protein